MRAMDMAWVDADRVTDAWAAAKCAAMVAAEAQAAAATATQAAAQAQQAAICAAERAEALDRADVQPPPSVIPLRLTDQPGTPPVLAELGLLLGVQLAPDGRKMNPPKSLWRMGMRKSPLQRLSPASPPALCSGKRCIGLTPFQDESAEDQGSAQQAWLQEAEERAKAADAEACREDARSLDKCKGLEVHGAGGPFAFPPPRAISLLGGTGDAAPGFRKPREEATTFLLQLRAIGRAS